MGALAGCASRPYLYGQGGDTFGVTAAEGSAPSRIDCAGTLGGLAYDYLDGPPALLAAKFHFQFAPGEPLARYLVAVDLDGRCLHHGRTAASAPL